MEIKDIKITAYQNKESQHKPMEVSLYNWLITDRYKLRIETMRNEVDADIQNNLKLALPACLPSGVFDANKKLVKHSGFLAIDIDAKDNPTFSPAELKTKISNIVNVFYCGWSCRGKGVWALIPILEPTRHLEHFRALYEVFLQHGIVIDKACSNINRLRFASYDSEPYFNYNAVTFTLVWIDEKKPKINLKSTDFKTQDNVFENFNQSGDGVGLLTNHGWKVIRQKGDKTELTRPDKTDGVSGDWNSEKRLFYSYTSSTVFDAGHAYNASQLFNMLECSGDWKETAKKLKELNY